MAEVCGLRAKGGARRGKSGLAPHLLTSAPADASGPCVRAAPSICFWRARLSLDSPSSCASTSSVPCDTAPAARARRGAPKVVIASTGRRRQPPQPCGAQRSRRRRRRRRRHLRGRLAKPGERAQGVRSGERGREGRCVWWCVLGGGGGGLGEEETAFAPPAASTAFVQPARAPRVRKRRSAPFSPRARTQPPPARPLAGLGWLAGGGTG